RRSADADAVLRLNGRRGNNEHQNNIELRGFPMSDDRPSRTDLRRADGSASTPGTDTPVSTRPSAPAAESGRAPVASSDVRIAASGSIDRRAVLRNASMLMAGAVIGPALGRDAHAQRAGGSSGAQSGADGA